jgi:hypothetical protein
MYVRHRLRVLLLASSFAATVTLVPTAGHLVSAEPINQTGPNGAQCHLKGMDGDFVDPENSDTTNNANIALSGLSGAPPMKVAGCDLVLALPPVPTPTATPIPVRNGVFLQMTGVAKAP